MNFKPQGRLVSGVAASPNFNDRKTPIDMLVLHYTGMESAEAALDWLRREESGVSCHYLIFEDGRIVQLVGEEFRAWHAGKSCWQGREDTNSRSIGIEIVNPGHEFGYPDFPVTQVESIQKLCVDICMRNAIIPQHVLAHSDVAPQRKRDPGEKFPWQRLASAGVGHWVPPAPIVDGPVLTIGDRGEEVGALHIGLAGYGYGVSGGDLFDEDMKRVVTAFQRHFRPARVDGVADSSTTTTLQALLDALSPSA